MAYAAMGGEAENGFRFFPPRHEPGEKILLGRRYQEGYRGGVQALTDLAQHRATARHIATSSPPISSPTIRPRIPSSGSRPRSGIPAATS